MGCCRQMHYEIWIDSPSVFYQAHPMPRTGLVAVARDNAHSWICWRGGEWFAEWLHRLCRNACKETRNNDNIWCRAVCIVSLGQLTPTAAWLEHYLVCASRGLATGTTPWCYSGATLLVSFPWYTQLVSYVYIVGLPNASIVDFAAFAD